MPIIKFEIGGCSDITRFIGTFQYETKRSRTFAEQRKGGTHRRYRLRDFLNPAGPPGRREYHNCFFDGCMSNLSKIALSSCQ